MIPAYRQLDYLENASEKYLARRIFMTRHHSSLRTNHLQRLPHLRTLVGSQHDYPVSTTPRFQIQLAIHLRFHQFCVAKVALQLLPSKHLIIVLHHFNTHSMTLSVIFNPFFTRKPLSFFTAIAQNGFRTRQFSTILFWERTATTLFLFLSISSYITILALFDKKLFAFPNRLWLLSKRTA